VALFGSMLVSVALALSPVLKLRPCVVASVCVQPTARERASEAQECEIKRQEVSEGTPSCSEMELDNPPASARARNFNSTPKLAKVKLGF